MKRFWFTILSCAVVVFCVDARAGKEVQTAAARFLRRKIGTGVEAEMERKARLELKAAEVDFWKNGGFPFRWVNAQLELGRIAHAAQNFDAANMFFLSAFEIADVLVNLRDSEIYPDEYNRAKERYFQNNVDAGLFWEKKGHLEKAYFYFDKASEFFDFYDLRRGITSSQIIGTRYFALLHRLQNRPKGFCWQVLKSPL